MVGNCFNCNLFASSAILMSANNLERASIAVLIRKWDTSANASQGSSWIQWIWSRAWMWMNVRSALVLKFVSTRMDPTHAPAMSATSFGRIITAASPCPVNFFPIGSLIYFGCRFRLNVDENRCFLISRWSRENIVFQPILHSNGGFRTAGNDRSS